MPAAATTTTTPPTTTTTVAERRAAARRSADAMTSVGAPVAAQAIERLEMVVSPAVVTGLLSPFIVVEVLVRTLVEAGRSVLIPSVLLAGAVGFTMARSPARRAVAGAFRSAVRRIRGRESP